MVDVHERFHTYAGVPIALSEHLTGSDRMTLLMPGITERRESLDGLARSLVEHVEHGTDVAVADLYGQGDSGGRWNLSEMIEGFGSLTDRYASSYEQRAIVGASAGGLIAAHVADSRDLSSLVLMSAPAGSQDLAPAWLLERPERIPRWLIEHGLCLYDRYQRMTNGTYRNRTAVEIDEHRMRDPKHLQFDGLRIGDPYAFLRGIKDAPRIDGMFAERAKPPTLFVYGGESSLFGIRDSKLPERLRMMVDTWNSEHKRAIIVDGADHSLNSRTNADEYFNHEERFQWVRADIASWISEAYAS